MTNETQYANNADTSYAATAAIAAKSLEQTITGLTEGMVRASACVEQSQAKLKDGIEKAMKKAEEMARLGQGNVEALTKSTQIWAAGVQTLSQEVAASWQDSVQETLGVLKTIGSAKSLKEAIELQSGLARTALEKAMSEGGRLTQASLKLTEQALAPITERVVLTNETFAKAA